MSKPVNSDMPESPDLVPVSELGGEWIDGYLQESAAPRGEEISSWSCHYPKEKPHQFRFVFSGVRRDRVDQYREEVKIDAKLTSRRDIADQNPLPDQTSQDEQGKEGDEADFDAKGGSEELPPSVNVPVLPDLELPVDVTDDNYEDTYYARLLREHPERILVTLEHLDPDQTSDEVTVISYTIDPSIDAGIVHHYRSKFQTGATTSVSATDGSVTLQMWRWFRDANNGLARESLGSQLSVAGAAEEQPSPGHSDFPNKSTYDVNVTGNQDGSEYAISGTWNGRSAFTISRS